jgi:hypothetical protein
MRLVKERWPNKLGWNVLDGDTEVAEIIDFSENMALHVRTHAEEGRFMSFPRTLDLLGHEVDLHPLDIPLERLVALTEEHGEELVV